MPEVIDSKAVKTSEYNQVSFSGGMVLSIDDTQLSNTQYRIGFNTRNRYGRLDPILSSKIDLSAPAGVIQEMTTFGNYEIMIAGGFAYYKLFTDTAWTKINGFQMSSNAPRMWSCPIPVSITNYYRVAATTTISGQAFSDSKAPISINNISGAAAGNLPGLLVQDNVNQPQFIFIQASTGLPTARTTQTFAQWSIGFTDVTNTVVGTPGTPDSTQDKREYVPIGNEMSFTDGVLYVASPDGNYIYRSVSGRPLDFVINVKNTLAGAPTFVQTGGGDATTTAYSVGVGPITALRSMSDGSLFVAAGNANFSVSKNTTINAITIFGEYTFIRKFLFNANCLNSRGIIDSTGDTRFIDLTGVRSFNAIEQLNNEGRNSVFTANIQGAFVQSKGTGFINPIIQNPSFVAAIVYDNYELYAMNTIFGPAIIVYDTLLNCWVGLDLNQTGGNRIKILTKIELAAQALYAVTEDDKVYRLYVGPGTDAASFRTVGVCSGLLWAGQDVKLANPKTEVKLQKTRVILNYITADCSLSFTPYINNRMDSGNQTLTKNIKYEAPVVPTAGILALSDVDTMLKNLLFSTPNCRQGWKVFGVFSWTGGSVTQFQMELMDITPQNPLLSQ